MLPESPTCRAWHRGSRRPLLGEEAGCKQPQQDPWPAPAPPPAQDQLWSTAEQAEASEAGLLGGQSSLRLGDPSWRPWTGCPADGWGRAREELPRGV